MPLRDTNEGTIAAAHADVRRTLDATRDGQIADRYTKAIEQLGSSTIDVTIGGIYALERIARDSPEDHPTVMEVLAACVREHSGEPLSGLASATDAPQHATRPDIQAAVTLIGRRDTTLDRRLTNLRRVKLPYADLPEADLSGADLTDADSPVLVSAPHQTGAQTRKYPRAASDNARIAARPRL